MMALFMKLYVFTAKKDTCVAQIRDNVCVKCRKEMYLCVQSWFQTMLETDICGARSFCRKEMCQVMVLCRKEMFVMIVCLQERETCVQREK